MSYSYVSKPFAVEDDDDDIDVFECLSSKNKKRKLPYQTGISQRSVSQIEKAVISSPNIAVNNLDSDNEILVSDNGVRANVVDIISDAPCPVSKNDDQISQAKTLLTQLRHSKTIAPKPTNVGVVDKATLLINKNTVAIKTASERIAEKETYLRNLLVDNNAVESVSSASNTLLKTRVNGKHEYAWRLSPDLKVSAWKSQFRELYGLKGDEKVVFRFEGIINFPYL